MPVLRLKQAIESKSFIKSYPSIGFLDSQLFGTFTVQAEARADLLNYMFTNNRETFRYGLNHPTTIYIASKTFALESLGSKLEDPNHFTKEELGYTFYIEKDDSPEKAYTLHIEELKTIFTVMSGNEVAGFFDFDLCLCQEKGQATLDVNLNQIFVKPEFRGTSYWLDLTVAVCSFAGEVLYSISNKLPKPYYLDVYVKADFINKSGEKIATAIEDEIRSMFEILPELAPHRPAFIGGVFADMGY